MQKANIEQKANATEEEKEALEKEHQNHT